MKNTFTLFVCLLMIGSLTTLNSCKKDDDSGYQPKGNYQAAGNYGNANINSGQFTVTWTQSAPSYYCTINDADITQAIVDYGYVEVYMSNGSGGWISLPCTLPMAASYSSTYTPVHYLGGVTVWKTDTDMTQAGDDGTTTFKVVCVSASARLANSNVNWNNYEEVKRKFNLPE